MRRLVVVASLALLVSQAGCGRLFRKIKGVVSDEPERPAATRTVKPEREPEPEPEAEPKPEPKQPAKSKPFPFPK